MATDSGDPRRDGESDPREGDHDDEIVHREIDTEGAEPAAMVARRVAELKEVDPHDLQPAHDCIDDVLSNVFSNPPASSAQVEITFSYEGYRISVEQNGRARFVELD